MSGIEIVLGIITAACAVPLAVQALGHCAKSIQQKLNSSRDTNHGGGVVRRSNQHQVASQSSRKTTTVHELSVRDIKTSHDIRIHDINTYHAVQFAGGTYHNVEHHVFIHFPSSITSVILAVVLLLAVLSLAYHLGHAHGYHGRSAVVQGIDLAVNHGEEPLVKSDADINPFISVLSFLTRILEGIGQGVLWVLSLPIRAIVAFSEGAYTFGRHPWALLETSFWVLVAALIFVLKTSVTVAMAVFCGFGTTVIVCYMVPGLGDSTEGSQVGSILTIGCGILVASLTASVIGSELNAW